MATAGQINIFVSAITKNFDKGVSNVHSKLRGLTKGFADINGALNIAQQAFGAATQVVSKLVDEIGRLDQIGDAAERLNITADSLVKLQRAAELTGGDVDGVAKSLAILQRTIGDASAGQSSSVAALDRLGLSAESLINLDLNTAFEMIVARISELPTPAERASVAADLFGKSASNLAGLMTEGVSAIHAATVEVDAFGASLDEVRMKQVDEAQKSIEKLTRLWSGLKAEMAIAAAPTIQEGADAGSSILRAFREGDLSIADTFKTLGSFGPVGLLAKLGQTQTNQQVADLQSLQDAQLKSLEANAPRVLPDSLESDLLDAFVAAQSLAPKIALGPIAGAGLQLGGSFAAFREAVGISAQSPEMRGPGSGAGALEFGSAGAFSAVQQSRREDESRRLMKQEVEESKKTNEKLDTIISTGLLAIETADLQL